MDQFRKDILKVNQSRKHKVTNSIGTRDIFKYIRKNKWFDIGQSLTEHQFYYIIRNINKLLIETLLQGKDIVFPNRMGILEIRNHTTKIFIKDNKVISTAPVDWDRTLKLWSEDEEAYKKRTLVKREEKKIYKAYYNRVKAEFNNKIFYTFSLNRELKNKLKTVINEGDFDSFEVKSWQDI